MGTKFILTVMATNVLGNSTVSNYSVSECIHVIDTDEKNKRLLHRLSLSDRRIGCKVRLGKFAEMLTM